MLIIGENMKSYEQYKLITNVFLINTTNVETQAGVYHGSVSQYYQEIKDAGFPPNIYEIRVYSGVEPDHQLIATISPHKDDPKYPVIRFAE